MMNRRNLLKTMGVASAALLPKRAQAESGVASETVGILVESN